MSSLADVYVQVKPDVRGVSRSMQTAGSESGRRFGAGFRDTVKTAIGNSMSTALDSIARGIGRGIKAVVVAGSDLNETINKSNVIFGQNAREINKWARGSARSFGLSRQEALEAAASFGDMFKQLGFGGDAASKMSRSTVQLAADLGSFNNLPTADVQERIAAAFRGEYDSLQQVIPNINAARVQQQAMAMTGKSNAQSLTAQEKAAATLAIINKDGARAAGDFARTQGGVANQTKIAKAQLMDIAGTIGTALQPAMGGLLKLITTRVLPAFTKWLPGAIENVKSAFVSGGAAITLFKNAFKTGMTEDEGTWIESIALGIRHIKEAIQPAIDTVKLFIGTLTGKGADVDIPWMNKTIDAAVQFRAVLGQVGNFITTTVLPALAGLGRFVINTVLPAWIQWEAFMAGQFWPLIKQLAGFFVANVLPALRTVVGFIVSTVVPGFLQIIGAVKQLAGVVIPIIIEIVGVILGKFNEMKPQIMSIWNSVKEIVTGAMFVIKEVIQAVTKIISMIWGQWGDNIKAIVGTVFKAIFGIVAGLMKAIAGIIKLVVALIKGDWKGAWNAIKQIFAGVWQAIKSILVGVLGLIKATFGQWLTGLYNKWKSFWGGMLTAGKNAINLIKDTINSVLGKIRDGFARGVTAIGKAWDKIVGVAKKPVKFVIQTVLDNGILAAVRAISGLVDWGPGKDIHVGLPSGWAKGTAQVLPGYTPGRDVHQFFSPTGGRLNLSGGEGIARPEVVRAVGKKAWDKMNADAAHGRLQEVKDNFSFFLGGVMPVPGGVSHKHAGYPWARWAGDLHASMGTPVHAWNAGQVAAVKYWNHSYGRHVRVNHPGNQQTLYAHLQRAIVSVGQQVRQNQVLGYSDSTGNSTGPHLHFELKGGHGVLGGKNGMGAVQALNPAKYLNMVKDALGKLKDIKGSPFGQMLAAGVDKIATSVKDKITSLAASFVQSTGAGAGFTAASGGSNRAIGRRMMLQRWGAGQWPALNSLWTKESGWRTTARNPSSGAYGIPQALPASKMASAGGDWRTNPATQIKWGLGYIAGRYGSPAKAWAHSQRTNWYGQGGVIDEPVLGLGMRTGESYGFGEKGKELVTPMDRLQAVERPKENKRGGRPVNIELNLGEDLRYIIQGMIDDNDEFHATMGRLSR